MSPCRRRLPICDKYKITRAGQKIQNVYDVAQMESNIKQKSTNIYQIDNVKFVVKPIEILFSKNTSR